eukprot:10533474-Lingulodinium_polyedra.AAC.1
MCPSLCQRGRSLSSSWTRGSQVLPPSGIWPTTSKPDAFSCVIYITANGMMPHWLSSILGFGG